MIEDFFEDIDTEAKAYVLGAIISDKSWTRKCLEDVQVNGLGSGDVTSIIAKQLQIDEFENQKMRDILGFRSKKMIKNILSWVKITSFSEIATSRFPDLETDDLKFACLRGMFDLRGEISEIKPGSGHSLTVRLRYQYSKTMMEDIKKFTTGGRFRTRRLDLGVVWKGNKALDFLGCLYENSTVHVKYRMREYQNWASAGWNEESLVFKWCRDRDDAKQPQKSQVSDSGFDLTVLEKIKQIGNVELYETGIKVEPAFGWYFDVVPRSSIIKTGYMLANSVGVIDRTYQGTIKVPLVKIDKDAPDLKLPNRIVQLIPRPIIHSNFVQVNDLGDETIRSTGGFGSTNE